MNILDYWPKEDPPLLDNLAWEVLLARRQLTFLGFVDLERESGFLDAPVSLSTAKGQEMARILMFRTLEEFVEAIQAKDAAHRLEELIDSLNYLWSLMCLDPDVSLTEFPARGIDPIFRGQAISASALHLMTYHLASATEFFRNRAWMHNAQDVYFNGADQLRESVLMCTDIILSHFESWEQFWRYFIAKDEVLQFRLRSHY